jgi:dipeptidyl-peptidase-4
VTDTFPRQHARTQRLTLGAPRNVTVIADDTALLFLRSFGGSDPVNRLWRLDLATGTETLLADPPALLAATNADADDLPPDERARRERMREGAGGITAYATDRLGATAVFALAGRLFVTDTATGATELAVPGPVFDPQPSPDGNRIAYVRGRSLCVVDRAGGALATIGEPGEPDTVSWGSADFVAAEEMHRYRGFWWSPDGEALAVCRVDESAVGVWHISDPAAPATAPRAVRYPAAGTANPDVELYIVRLAAPTARVRVKAATLDGPEWPYLVNVSWTEAGLAAVTQSRDQRTVVTLWVNPATGATTELFTDSDPQWVELVPGGGTLVEGPDGMPVPVNAAARDGAHRLIVGDRPVSPADVQVRAIVDATAERVIVTGNPLADPTVLHVYRWTTDGFTALSDGDGVHGAAAGDDLVIVGRASLDAPGTTWRLPDGGAIASLAEVPLVRPNLTLSRTPGDGLAVAVLLPTGRARHDGGPPLPVLLDPYGGPHAQRVVQSYNAHCASQWFAEQGFAVVVVDGRGTPGRGTAFERAVFHDLAGGVLADQIAGLQHAADEFGVLDLERVAIRGWSFGGYLAALAVLQRPDVFHAAVAGAPVTEWRLYDTHYTERYLGDPNARPDVYDANSLLPLAPRLTRPLLMIHGLADDNVVAAHTLQLSSALLAAGRPHEVLPLVGVTHMTPQEVVAENLLVHQLEFLRKALDVGPAAPLGSPTGGDRLSELYRGVAVHANADAEHVAALELLALVMASDSTFDPAEIEAIRAISGDWRDDEFRFDVYLDAALGKAQAAIDSGEVLALIDEIDTAIASRVLRRALFSAAREVAGVDDDVSPEEGSILAEIAARFG